MNVELYSPLLIRCRGTRAFAYIALAILFRSLGSICMKQTAILGADSSFPVMLLNPWYAGALLSFFLQSIVWTLTLRRISLSAAYPYMSLFIVCNMFSAAFLFREAIHLNHIAGALLVLTGVWTIARQSD